MNGSGEQSSSSNLWGSRLARRTEVIVTIAYRRSGTWTRQASDHRASASLNSAEAAPTLRRCDRPALTCLAERRLREAALPRGHSALNGPQNFHLPLILDLRPDPI